MSKMHRSSLVAVVFLFFFYSRKSLIQTSIIQTCLLSEYIKLIWQSQAHYFQLLSPMESWLQLFKWLILSVSWLSLPVEWQLKTQNNANSQGRLLSEGKSSCQSELLGTACTGNRPKAYDCAHSSTCYICSVQKFNFQIWQPGNTSHIGDSSKSATQRQHRSTYSLSGISQHCNNGSLCTLQLS